MNSRIIGYLALFSSLGTLVCCALPALFVALGLGATFVSLIGAFPQLIWLSEHKLIVFVIAGALLVITGIMRVLGRNQSCPTDSNLAKSCGELKRSGTVIFYLSILCYVVGGFFAFIASAIFQ